MDLKTVFRICKQSVLLFSPRLEIGYHWRKSRGYQNMFDTRIKPTMGSKTDKENILGQER
jgi:hypothetical protein